jgi:integrase
VPRRARGEGNITYHKTNGNFQVKVPTGRTLRSGRPEFRYATAPTEAEALIKKQALLRQIADNTLPEINRLTVAQYLESFLTESAPRWSARTLEINTNLVRSHLTPTLGRINLAKLTPLDISRAQGHIAKPRTRTITHTKREREVRVGGANTAHQARRLLVQALNTAVRYRLIATNPAVLVEPVRLEKPEYTILEPDEVARLLETTKRNNPWLYALIYTAFDTAMRPGELRGLGWQHLRQRGTTSILEVRRTAKSTPGPDPRTWYGSEKTINARRDIPISTETLHILEEHRARILEHAKKHRVTWTDHNVLFPSRNGTPLHAQNFAQDLDTLCAAARVPRMTPHDMRHTGISLMIWNNLDVRDIADHVGHASAAFTLSRYAHVFGAQRNARTRLSLTAKLRTSNLENEASENPEVVTRVV